MDLLPHRVFNASDILLTMTPVDGDQTVSGQPHTGSTALGIFAGLDVGIWEMTPGTMRDVEAEELFIVVSGSARVEFADGSPPLDLAPGDVVRLTEGTQTVWTVHETLRKVYLA